MSRRTSFYEYKGFWLDRRRDGTAPDIWQIASVNQRTRSTTYRSTKERDIEFAIKALRHFADTGELVLRPKPERLRSSDGKIPTRKTAEIGPLDAPVLPAIMVYWAEHGSHAISRNNIAASIRHFTAFCEIEGLGDRCTFNDVSPQFVKRYIAWRMAPHSYTLSWQGKTYRAKSSGVSGRTVKGEIADIKAALNYSVEHGRVPYIRRIPSFPSNLLKPPRRIVASLEAIGAMIAFAQADTPLLNWLLLMLATGARPTAAMKVVPTEQFESDFNRLDLHPIDAPLTKKRNPTIPVIAPLAEMLRQHEGPWVLKGDTVNSLNRRWRLMIEALGLTPSLTPYSMRHTVASHLAWLDANPDHISRLLGHEIPTGSAASYQIYSPAYMSSVVPALSRIWLEAHLHAKFWQESYVVVCSSKGRKFVADRSRLEALGISSSKIEIYARTTPQIENGGLEMSFR